MDDFEFPIIPEYLDGIPAVEIFWVDYRINGITKYVITSDRFRSWYYLYSVNKNGKCTKTKHKAHKPDELYPYMR